MHKPLIVGCLSFGLLGCWQGDEYLQRSDTVTLSAGNAKDQNASNHMIDPWPRYVGDRRIPGNGARGVRAVECYEQRDGQPIRPMYDPNRPGGTASGAGGGGGGAPAGGGGGNINIQLNSGQAQGKQGGGQAPSLNC